MNNPEVIATKFQECRVDPLLSHSQKLWDEIKNTFTALFSTSTLPAIANAFGINSQYLKQKI